MQKSLTSTAAQRPRQPRKPKAEHLCMTYPDWPYSNHPHYWLAVYLRGLAEQAAMRALYMRLHTKTDHITEHAACRALTELESKTEISAKYTLDDGLLLYAWPGTKFFDSAKPQ